MGYVPAIIGVSAVVACAAMLGTEGPVPTVWGWDIAWTAAAVTAVVGMLVARARALPGNRCRWSWWAAAATSWLVGQIAWDVFGATGTPQSPNVADIGWWGFAVLVIVSLLRLPAASRSVRLVAGLEALPVVVAGMALTFGELWRDASASSLPLAAQLSALMYPALYVTAAVLTLQAMVGGSLSGVRSRAMRLVLGGIVAQALAFILWSEKLLEQTYVTGTTLLDPLWVVGLIVIGVGGAVAATQPEALAEKFEPTHRGGILPAASFLLLLGALVELRFDRAPLGAAITLAVGLLFSGAALIVRSALLERRLRVLLARERLALASLAEREAQLARLNERLVEDSRRDALTGMRNRRALSDDLPAVEAGHRERGESLALALCDVDRFKVYNDRLGHLAGDQALRAVAASIRGALREGDSAYRFGGEELLLVIRNADAAAAQAAAERVRTAVEEAALPHPDGIGGILTVSIGVAAGHEDSGTLVGLADAALYEAKRSGRNQVVVASGSDLPVVSRHRCTVHEDPVPRHLRGMLEVSRAAASGRGDLPVLEALAHTIHSELSFQVVAMNVLHADRGELEVVAVIGDAEAREALLGTVNPWSEWEPLMDSAHARCGAIWLPAGSHQWAGETTVWTPAVAPALGPDAWDPLDMLLLPVRGAGGDILAIMSVDQPLSGRRPDDSELAVLMAVADHAGLALERSRQDQRLGGLPNAA